MAEPDDGMERWLERQPRDVQWCWALTLAVFVGGLALLLLVIWIVR